MQRSTAIETLAFFLVFCFCFEFKFLRAWHVLYQRKRKLAPDVIWYYCYISPPCSSRHWYCLPGKKWQQSRCIRVFMTFKYIYILQTCRMKIAVCIVFILFLSVGFVMLLQSAPFEFSATTEAVAQYELFRTRIPLSSKPGGFLLYRLLMSAPVTRWTITAIQYRQAKTRIVQRKQKYPK